MILFLYIGRHFPNLTVPQIIKKMRRDSRHAIIAGESYVLKAYLQKRKRQGVRVNINHLGEAVLGEKEALSRLAMYISDLKNPAIDYISVKISTIFSQIQPLAFEDTVGILKDRLSQLYRAAAAQQYIRADGSKSPKFVNLDMESYRDLEITVAAFIRTLDQKEFLNYSAGMALQAYLPDSHILLQKITAWARKRISDGGSPIRIRIVKGANTKWNELNRHYLTGRWRLMTINWTWMPITSAWSNSAWTRKISKP